MLALVATPAVADDYQMPEGFTASIFAEAPDIYSPAAFAVSPFGDVYVGIDMYNSGPGREEGLSSVILCRDTDDDGKADAFTTFADNLCSPQGLTFVNETLYVVHAPYLTAFRDTDGDHVADESTVLVNGLGPAPEGLVHHIPSGLHMGIDGWLYISIGDKGIKKAVGTDRSSVSLLGGGIVRVRPDGTELELYAEGLRNTLDVAVDPFLNLYTRDNTNDGGGWNVRLSVVQQYGEYGYPSLYINFADQIVPAIADYGGGSGTGCTYADEGMLPEPYQRMLFTTDWGRGWVYTHPMSPDGATFTAEQHGFFKGEKPVDVAVDAQGFVYVCDWGNRGWGNIESEGVRGTIYRIEHETRAGDVEWVDLDQLSPEQLISMLGESTHLLRLEAQQRLLKLEPTPAMKTALVARIRDAWADEASRVAALYTMNQMFGASCADQLIDTLADDVMREHAIRGLTDRRPLNRTLDPTILKPYLRDPNPRVRQKTAIALGRFPRFSMDESWSWPVADPDVTVRHATMQSLRRLAASEYAFNLLRGTLDRGVQDGALRALAGIRTFDGVNNLGNYMAQVGDIDLQTRIVRTLGQLYAEEALYDGSWWGTRPSTKGPYYKPVRWAGSDTVLNAYITAISKLDPAVGNAALEQIGFHRIQEALRLASAAVYQQLPVEQTAAEVMMQLEIDTPDMAMVLQTIPLREKFDPELEAAAIRKMGKIPGRDAFSMLSTVIRRLHSADRLHGPRLEAVLDVVAASRDPEFVVNLAVLTRGYPIDVQAAAFEALLQIDSDRARSTVEIAWNYPDRTAALLLAMSRVPASGDTLQTLAPRIRTLMSHPDAELRAAAVAAASAVPDPDIVDALIRLVENGDLTAGQSLGRMGSEAITDAAVVRRAAEQLVQFAEDTAGRLDAATHDAVIAAAQMFATDARVADDELLARLAQISGVLVQWDVLGPLNPIGTMSPFDSRFAPEQSASNPTSVTVTTERGTSEWQPHVSTDPGGRVWLSDLFGRTDSMVTYLATQYRSNAAVPATLFIGSDDSVTVWLNGVLVHANNVNRGMSLYQDTVTINLRAGDNVFLFKVTNTGGPCGVAARIRPESAELTLGSMSDDVILASLSSAHASADPTVGAELFDSLTCAQCHTVDQSEDPRGPYLGDIAARYGRDHLVDSILNPSATIAQGFQTQSITYKTTDGYGQDEVSGFIVSESGDAITIRTLTADEVIIAKSDILGRTTSDVSSMPTDSADRLTVEEFASLLAYLESLK